MDTCDDETPEEVSLQGEKDKALSQQRAVRQLVSKDRQHRRDIDKRLKEQAAQRRLRKHSDEKSLGSEDDFTDSQRLEASGGGGAKDSLTNTALTLESPRQKRIERVYEDDNEHEIILQDGPRIIQLTEGWRQRITRQVVDRAKASKEALMNLKNNTRRATAAQSQAYLRYGKPAVKFFPISKEGKLKLKSPRPNQWSNQQPRGKRQPLTVNELDSKNTNNSK